MSEQEKQGEWLALPFTEADKQWLEQQEHIYQQIIRAFGIPPSLLGIDKNTNVGRPVMARIERAFLGEKHE